MAINTQEHKQLLRFDSVLDSLPILKKKQSKQLLAISMLLSACGSKNTDNDTTLENDITDEVSVLSTLTVELSEETNYVSPGIAAETLNSAYAVLKTVEQITDSDLEDSDILNITTGEDISITPIVSGIEKVYITVDSNFVSSDNTFTVDLENFSNFDSIEFSLADDTSPVTSIDVKNASDSINIGSGISTIDISVKDGDNITLTSNENAQIEIMGESENLSLDGNGKSLSITTSNLQNISIIDNDYVGLTAPNATGNISITSNGPVTLFDSSEITENVEISAIGNITLNDISSSKGHLNLDNIRGPNGEYIRVLNAGNVKSVDINSAGSFVSSTGLSNAEKINISVREDTSITALTSGVIERDITLKNSNTNGDEVTFILSADNIDSLSLGGSSPIFITIDSSYITGVPVTSTNPTSSTILLTAADVDISNISSNVDVRLANSDGKNISLGQNQTLAMDAEIAQTASVGVPNLNLTGPLTNNETSTINIKTIDTDRSNSDNLVSLAGINVNGVKLLNIDLTSGVDFESTSDINAGDLEQIHITGSGNFNLNSNKIVGSLGNPINLSTSDFTGNLNLSLSATDYGVKNISSGAGDDTIILDDSSSTNSGYFFNLGDGNDILSLTSNADGTSAILSINGGNGFDEVKFENGMDFWLSNISLSNVEYLEFTGGGTSTKLPSDILSSQSYNISEIGSGTLQLELLASNPIIDLSKLSFDSSIAVGSDKIIIHGANYSSALTITASSLVDEISGTSSFGDTIIAGNGDDIINGYGGNDTITPGNGADQVTPGLGNDIISLAEDVSSSDTLFYAGDSGVNNVDSIAGFDVIIVDDKISLDTSETTYEITEGGGAAVDPATTVTIINHSLDTDLDHSTSVQENIFKLTQTDQSEFAGALGTSVITVANNASIPFLWYDADTSEAVFGFVYENSAAPDDDTLTSEDTFFEIVRLSIDETSYMNYLDSDNFIFT